jgi:hypothetical protein
MVCILLLETFSLHFEQHEQRGRALCDVLSAVQRLNRGDKQYQMAS